MQQKRKKERKKERAGITFDSSQQRRLQRGLFVDLHATLLSLLKPGTSFTMKEQRFVTAELAVKAGVVMLPYNLFLEPLLPQEELIALLLDVSPELLEPPHLPLGLAHHL